MKTKLNGELALMAVISLLIIEVVAVIIRNFTQSEVTYQLTFDTLALGVALFISLLLLFFNVNFWKYFLAIVLTYYTFAPANLTSYSIGFTIGFTVELLPFALLIAHLFIHSEILKPLLEIFRSSDVKSEEESNTRLSYFMKKFDSKSSKELELIANDNDRQQEAREAARGLMSHREGQVSKQNK